MFFHLWFEVYAKRLLNDKYMYYHTLHSRLMLDQKQVVPKRYERCSSWGCCYQIFKVLRLLHFKTDRH